ncbi:putative 2-dehydropantoate 2-reductase [Mangrovibacterium marinum]|uniref:2-dehydropantoate 2-reductase n=1 Tax=Mangrovibacterium marinum TaxID=1639118 RepID=A0A2T5C5Q0_9BACT|nr:putative 2-dehydropantoate 2-reductase [Mangrovibacterium marinum]PTN10240.1 ketopantoate reductase [Mangrovibacterium marinum]
MNLRYAVIGTGALGGFYGGMLAKNGQDVHFLLNSDYQQVRDLGLRVDSVTGDFVVKPIHAYSNASAMPKADVVLVCLKTTNNHLLKELLSPIMHEDTIVVLIQNGLGVEQQAAASLPGAQIAGALAFICSSKVGPGHIHHLDLGKLTIGSFNLKQPEVLQQIRFDFNDAGVPCQLTDDLAMARWQKLVWNVPFNGLTVVLNATTDQIMANEESSKLAHEMMYEVVDAANASGVPLKRDFADKMMAVTAKMTPYAPSMKLDYEHKRPMEIDAIYSQPIAEALKCGFKMSKVEVLEKQLHFYNAMNLQ